MWCDYKVCVLQSPNVSGGCHLFTHQGPNPHCFTSPESLSTALSGLTSPSESGAARIFFFRGQEEESHSSVPGDWGLHRREVEWVRTPHLQPEWRLSHLSRLNLTHNTWIMSPTGPASASAQMPACSASPGTLLQGPLTHGRR